METTAENAFGWAARDPTGILSPFSFSLRSKKDDDIILKVLYCGICHTDLSTIRNEWGNARYPVVPGHEIVGVVTEVGCNVQKFKVGDKVGVGYLAGSCIDCNDCNQDYENYCLKSVPSFNSTYYDGSKTYGGYSDTMVVNEHFAIQLPDTLPLDKVAPLLCAGITVYTSLKYQGLNQPGMHLGVVGLGGLGHMAVKFAKAYGMKVTVISSTPSKEKEALTLLGADTFLLSRDEQQMKTAIRSMDGVVDTVSANHDIRPFISLIKRRGKFIFLGGATKPLEIPVTSLIFEGITVAGACIGGIKDTQEMIDFAAENNITADVEVISMDNVNTAMDRLARGDVKYRFVIDIANTIRNA